MTSPGKNTPGKEWDGTAPLADPLGTAHTADLREFEVSPDFNTASVTATISWSAGTGLSYGLDLFIDRYDAATDSWVQVGSGTNGQLARDGEPTETAEAVYPPPGRYRTRVVNFASTEQASRVAQLPSRGRAARGAPPLTRPSGTLSPQAGRGATGGVILTRCEKIGISLERRAESPASSPGNREPDQTAAPLR